jgi:SHS2 domain-containing protein
MKRYEYFDVTADVGITAYGKSLDELFENAALATFGVMCNLKMVEAEITENVEIKSEDLYSLLYDWLTHLLVLRDEKNMLFSKFEVKVREKEFFLKGKAYGEEINLEKHEPGVEVKAVTYHMMDVERNENWKARFILDI